MDEPVNLPNDVSIKVQQEQDFKEIIRRAQIGSISKVIDHIEVENVPLSFLNDVVLTLSSKETFNLITHVASLTASPRIIGWQNYLMSSLLRYDKAGILIHKNGSTIDLLAYVENIKLPHKENIEKALVILEFLKRLDPSIKISAKCLERQISILSRERDDFLKLILHLHNIDLLPSLNTLPKSLEIEGRLVRYLVSQSLGNNSIKDVYSNPLLKIINYDKLYNEFMARLDGALNNYLANSQINYLASNEAQHVQNINNVIFLSESFINCHQSYNQDKKSFLTEPRSSLYAIKLFIFLEHLKNTKVLKNRIINFIADFKNRKTEDADFLISRHPKYQSVNYSKISRTAASHIELLIKSLSLDKQNYVKIAEQTEIISDFSKISDELLEKINLSMNIQSSNLPTVKLKI